MRAHFQFWPRGREREEKESNKPYLFDLRSSVDRILLSQGLKFIASTRATCGYQKGEVSPKIQMRNFQEIEDFGLRRLPTHATMLQDVGILPTMVLVPTFGLIFGLKIVEWFKGLFRQKNAQNLTFSPR